MKLIVMDVEGTLFKAKMKIDGTDYPSTMWQPIAQALGEAAVMEERKTHEKWDNLEYSNYIDWVKASIDIHRKYGLKKDVFDKLIKAAEYNEGVEEFFQALDRREWVPVLISGGFQNLIRRAQNELNIEYGFGACEYYFNDDGYLEHYNIQPSDFDGKIHFLKTLLNTFNLNMKTDWVFVGDGKNDVAIASKAPLAFGINPHEKLKKVNGLIEVRSFVEILPYLKEFSERAKDTSQGKTATKSIVFQKQGNDSGDSNNRRVNDLIIKNRELKQKLNNIRAKEEKKARIQQIPVNLLDYEKTPRESLNDLLKDLNVVFLGLREHYESYRRLETISGLRVLCGTRNNFDLNVIKEADFLFIYKNCIKHSAVWRACNCRGPSACCYLLEHTNSNLLENALANVLYKYIYGKCKL